MTIHIKKNGQQHQPLTIDKVNVRPKTPSTNSEELPPGRGPEDVWNSLLRTALALPGVKVDRKAFLRRVLSKHVTEKVLQCVIRIRTPGRLVDCRHRSSRFDPVFLACSRYPPEACISLRLA